MSKNLSNSDYEKKIQEIINDSVSTIKNSVKDLSEIFNAIELITKTIKNGHKIVVFGNGGSAADAQHIAGELVGKFLENRQSFPAIALTTDTSILTAIGNDFSFDKIFSRQCESLVTNNDVVIGISTSGNSTNVLEGLKTSKNLGAKTIGLFGSNGKIKDLVDIPLVVNSVSTPRIQETHRIIYHIICQMVEENLNT